MLNTSSDAARRGAAWRHPVRSVTCALAVLSMVAIAGCARPGGGGGAGSTSTVDPAGGVLRGMGPIDVTSAPPSATSGVTPSALPSPTPTPSARRTVTVTKPQPGVTVKVTPKPPPAVAAPPPPPPPPAPGCTPSLKGTNAPRATVSSTLVASGATQYWLKVWSVQPPPDLVGQPAPPITIPANLMKAIAWQESGWQSAILACDGGIGTMQVMPATAEWMNQRFRTGYDVQTLAGNVALGTELLEWSVMYFGLYYFDGNVDITNTAVKNSGYTLLDAVIASYNVGYGAVGNEDGTISVPNPAYLSSVKGLMTTCACLAY